MRRSDIVKKRRQAAARPAQKRDFSGLSWEQLKQEAKDAGISVYRASRESLERALNE